jgi:nucleotide-binding universal stress UspA family protein
MRVFTQSRIRGGRFCQLWIFGPISLYKKEPSEARDPLHAQADVSGEELRAQMTSRVRKPAGDAARPILVPVDFSEHSRAALRWAAAAAPCFDAPIIALHVVHDPEAGPGYYARPERDGFLRRMEEAGEELMKEFLERVRSENPGLEKLRDLEATLVVGLPTTRILEVAEETAARMIVMGSQGRTGLSRFLLGSKAQRVVQLAPVPVTIVKARRAQGRG